MKLRAASWARSSQLRLFAFVMETVRVSDPLLETRNNLGAPLSLSAQNWEPPKSSPELSTNSGGSEPITLADTLTAYDMRLNSSAANRKLMRRRLLFIGCFFV